jgi:hypothetical protein
MIPENPTECWFIKLVNPNKWYPAKDIVMLRKDVNRMAQSVENK